MTSPSASHAPLRRRSRRAASRLGVVAWLAGAPFVAFAAGVAGGPGALASTPPALGLTVSPCNAARQGAPCGSDPAQLQVDLPNGTGDVTAVQISWVPEAGRSSPVPSGPAFLPLTGSNSSCAAPAYCWAWPQALDYSSGGTSWVLNGTYEVTPCGPNSKAGSCTTSADYSAPPPIQIADAPAPPANLSAASQGGTITLHWQAGPEPDLVGYLISRNSEDIYTCTTNGFGPGAGRSCASPPSFSDSPGVGTWRYQVEALRFGPDASPSHVVHSLGSTVTSSVNGAVPANAGGSGSFPAAGGSGGVPTVHIAPPPIPSAGIMPAFVAPTGVAGRPPTTASAPEGESGAAGVNANLPYSDNPALGADATGTAVRPPPKPVKNVNSVAEIAFAVIALSLAVHAWYIRDELRRAAGRVAARKGFDTQGLQAHDLGHDLGHDLVHELGT